MLLHDNFADGILTINVARDPTLKEKSEDEKLEDNDRLEIDDDTFMKFCLTKNNISDYGLGFLYEVMKDLVISKEFIETLYRVIIKISRTK